MATSTNWMHWPLRGTPSLARLRASGFIRNVGILSGGSALGHLFTLAVSPLLTRIYSPADFGAFGLFSSFLNVMAVTVALGYETSIPSGKDEAETGHLTLISLLLGLPLSVLGGVVSWASMRNSVLNYGVLPRVSPLLFGLTMWFVGIFTTLRYWSVRNEQFGQVSRGVIAQNAGRALSQTAVGALGQHSIGLLLGEMLGRGMGMTRMVRSAWPALRTCVMRLRREDLPIALWKHRKFPLYSLPASLIDALCLSLTVPLLIGLYGQTFGGYYSLVWRAITTPSLLLTVAIADTFHSRMAICARETPGAVMALFRKTSLGLLICGCVPALVIWFWGAPLFRWFFGAQWTISGQIAVIIVPWYLTELVVSPVSRVVMVLRGQELKLMWDVLSLGSLLMVFYLSKAHGPSPLATIKVLTLVNTMLRLLYFAVLFRIVQRFEAGHKLKIQSA